VSRYSILAGFAYNVAQTFACSADFYAGMAWYLGVPEVTIDLLTRSVFPTPFRVRRNEDLVERCATQLTRTVARSAPVPAQLTGAVLVCEFELTGRTDANRLAPPQTLRGRFTVVLTDERGRPHVGHLGDDILVDGRGLHLLD
jgi:hypothetical protein